MSGAQDVGQEPTAASLEQQKAQQEIKEQIANRSKKQSKKKGRVNSNFGQQEEVVITDGRSDFVRVMKVDSRRDQSQEDPHKVQLSKEGKAAQLRLSDDRLTVTGYKGFRTARCSHGVHQGTWYCEIKVTRLGSTGHVRLGWCTKKAELQAPVGFDEFGYCYRDLEGSKVYQGLRESYAEGYGEGDVIGLFLHMPEGGRTLETQDRNVVRFKGAFFYVDEPEPKPQPLEGSIMAFTKNGVYQGVAYSQILEGTYYPAAALFTLPEQTEGATVTFNFGPDFQHPPPIVEGCPPARAMCELAVPPSVPTLGDAAGPATDGEAGAGQASATADAALLTGLGAEAGAGEGSGPAGNSDQAEGQQQAGAAPDTTDSAAGAGAGATAGAVQGPGQAANGEVPLAAPQEEQQS